MRRKQDAWFVQKDPLIFWLSIAATLVGLFAVLDATTSTSLASGGSWISSEFKRQLAWVFVCAVAYIWISTKDVKFVRRWSIPFFYVLLVACILVLIPGIGITRNGASRWLGYGSLQFQPAELIKIALVGFVAVALTSKHMQKSGRIRDWIDFAEMRLIPAMKRWGPVVAVLFLLLLVELEPDLGTAFILAAIAFGALTLARVPFRGLIAILLVCAALGVLFTMSREYRVERFAKHADRWEQGTVDGTSFQSAQAELAMAYGGSTGVGIAQGRAKHVLPEAHTDFVFVTIAEEFGLLGSLLVVLLLGGLSLRLLSNAMATNDDFVRIVLGSVGWWIGVQTVLNLLMAGGALPAIGIPLPFMSYGGTSLLTLAIAIGACQAVMRGSRVREDAHEAHRDRRRHGRARLSRA